jgi:hypothetical protein
MKRFLVLFLAIVLVLAACGGKPKGPPAAGGTATAPAGKAAPGSPADKLTAPPTAPDIPADQSTPITALNGFFSSINIALDPSYQAAGRDLDKEPEKGRKYLDARARLRQIFLSADTYNEVCAYLDLIQMQKAEVVGDADISGDKAKVRVKLTKGDRLAIDPMAFGEKSRTEATVTVQFVKDGDLWKIEDFGGLMAKEKAKARKG